ncbi:MAG: deoxynucleoside kinase [Rhodothermales bacterium]|nr:deoxynucleoside kinase [Rhodothermales bacterium]
MFESMRYIVIEGVIGVGKTSLARILAQKFKAMLVLEEFEQNPFLERFYGDRPRWAFQTQLSFLASRFRQQQLLMKPDLFHSFVVADYAFDKDRIFAHLNLDGDERQLYETMFKLMQSSTPVPDLVVYLQSTPQRLMSNIRLRARSFEKTMDPEYITSLNDAYNYYFFRYVKSPLLIVNTEKIDFVNNLDDLEQLVDQIRNLRHPGTTYFNPVPSATLF